jgi:solute carrier family 25 phosphate transporter 23/24/25/41
MMSQAVVYPLDTLKFRMQCETVAGGEHGNKLIWHTAKKMWARNGIVSFYRGLPMGLAGMFPYAAIDLFIFETAKKRFVARNMKLHGLKHEEDALPNNFTLALMGGCSGAIGASAVYPVNLLRTRLQSQGTAGHPRTYTGIVDVTKQTLEHEGYRGLFKGLTPNLLKVVPAVSIVRISHYRLCVWQMLTLLPDVRRVREHQEGDAFTLVIITRL